MRGFKNATRVRGNIEHLADSQSSWDFELTLISMQLVLMFSALHERRITTMMGKKRTPRQ